MGVLVRHAMVNISNAVSETALTTLMARARESRGSSPLIVDPVGIELLGSLERRLDADTIERVLHRRLPQTLVVPLALRGRHYDRAARDFRERYDDALVVSLGAGFDTRFFRVENEPWPYIEVDLPDVMALKKELLGERATYRMIGGSVLDTEWIDAIVGLQSRHVLFLAEGLLMYLQKHQVIKLFSRLATSFSQSEILFEVVAEMYTRGILKKMVASKMKRAIGSKSSVIFEYGIKEAREIESYAPGLEVISEWSYFEEPDLRPRLMRMLRHVKPLTRTQWSIRASLT